MASAYLIGYGKMGKKIHELASSLEVEITGHSGKSDSPWWESQEYESSDAVIEFTRPEAAEENIRRALKDGKAVISGTTGWEEQIPSISKLVEERAGRFFYASNFSVGANILFALNRLLAQWMSTHSDYTCSIEEIHHTQKLDKPSGTAKTLAKGVIDHHRRYKGWTLEEDGAKLHINSIREEGVRGIHEVRYSSTIDEISIRHEAHSRDGFALGALNATLWLLQQKPGTYGMTDMLGMDI
jgi:4-hydroxy-tetrahydrodipicolinate reductase